MTAESFAVDLGSLGDFATELTTQLGGMAGPLGQLASLVDVQLRLGAFGEAHSLDQEHQQAVAELQTLLSQARDAIEFAQQVTGMVGQAYQNYDKNAAGAVNALAGSVLGTVSGVTGSALDTVGGLTDSALNTVGGLTDSALNTVGGVTNTVGGVTDPIVASLLSIVDPKA